MGKNKEGNKQKELTEEQLYRLYVETNEKINMLAQQHTMERQRLDAIREQLSEKQKSD